MKQRFRHGPPVYPHFRYHRPGFVFAVYLDRVVVTRRRYFTAVTTVHPIAHIAQVVIRGAPARLHILMDDGSATSYALVGQVAAAHDVISRLR